MAVILRRSIPFSIVIILLPFIFLQGQLQGHQQQRYGINCSLPLCSKLYDLILKGSKSMPKTPQNLNNCNTWTEHRKIQPKISHVSTSVENFPLSFVRSSWHFLYHPETHKNCDDKTCSQCEFLYAIFLALICYKI